MAGDFSDRLKELIGGQSRLSFARQCGFTDGALKVYLKGGKPSIDKALQIAKACNVNLEWLLSGEGQMHPDGTQQSNKEDDDSSFISRLEIEASAGPGSAIDSERIIDCVPFKRQWLQERGLDPKYLNVISVRGDSMEPTLSDGQTILVNRADVRLRSGIYIINLYGDLLVKRVQRLLNGDLKITSDNPRYDPEIVPSSQIDQMRIVGRVVWKGGLDL